MNKRHAPLSYYRQNMPKEHVYLLAGVSLGCTLGLWLGTVGFGIIF